MVHSGQEASIPVMDMSSLIALLEASETGSYVLDEMISDALCKSKFRTCIAGLPDEQGGLWMYEFDGHAPSSALRVTQSLDAALAMAERVKIGTLLEVQGCWNPLDPAEWPAWTIRWYPAAAPIDGKSWWAQIATARTPALALCVAILKAKAESAAAGPIQHGYEASGEVSPNLKAYM